MDIKNRIIFYTLLLVGLLSGPLNAQDVPPEFPASWVGEWTGDLKIFNNKGLQQTVSMKLEIAPIDSSESFTWQLVYNEGQDQRPYELQIVDAEKGHYQIDEKNSIVLDVYYLAGKLYSRFEVAGNLLLITYELQGEELIFEVISGRESDKKWSGGEEIDGNTIPKVASYAVGTRQVARLTQKY